MRKLLIITALPEEMEAVLNLLPNGRKDWSELRIDEGYSYFEAKIENGENPFLCKITSQAQQGPIYASAHTTLMLQSNPDLLFMTGICAGNPNKGLKIGDVVISDMAFSYETGKQTETGFHPEIECSNVEPFIVQLLKDYCWSNNNKTDADGKDYGLYVGSYATGSSVVSRKQIFDDLQVRERNVLALDMEAYSVLKTVEISNKRIPSIVIKSVCDFADLQKNDDAHKIASEIAAKTTLEAAKYLLERVPPKPVVKTADVIYPIALPRPALTYGHRLLWHSVLRWNNDSYSEFARDFETGKINEEHQDSGLEFYDLGNNKWLLEVTVGLGAYQGTYRYYYLDESGNQRKWKEVLFRSLLENYLGETRESMEPELSGIPYFDPESNTISTFFKGRGLGDCGSFIKYKFSAGETELLEYRHRDMPDPDEDVDSDNAPSPEEWEPMDVTISYPKWSEEDETPEGYYEKYYSNDTN